MISQHTTHNTNWKSVKEVVVGGKGGVKEVAKEGTYRRHNPPKFNHLVPIIHPNLIEWRGFRNNFEVGHDRLDIWMTASAISMHLY